MCGGGGGGNRALEQEEKDLLTAQRRAAEQGFEGREAAMGGYRSMITRGLERGSVASLDATRSKAMSGSLAASGVRDKMVLNQLTSRGAPLTDAVANGLLARSFDTGAQAAESADLAAERQQQAALQQEGAGYSGMAGFDPSNALGQMGNLISSAQTRSAQASAANAQGWGQAASAAMYGLKNYDDIASGASKLWDALPSFPAADGGLVPEYAAGGIVRPVELANGGNVFDQAQQQFQQTGVRPRTQMQAPPQPGVDPVSAVATASKLVNKMSAKTLGGSGVTPAADAAATLGTGSSGASTGMGLKPAADAAAALGTGSAEGAALGGFNGIAAPAGTAAAEGLGTAAAATAAEGAAAGTAAATGAAGAGASGLAATLGAAMPWVGGAVLLGSALGLFRDGGSVKPNIGGDATMPGGRAHNPAGGKVRGPGGPKDDKVPAWLSPGEFVMPVEAVRKYGLDRLESMRQKALNPQGARRQA